MAQEIAVLPSADNALKVFTAPAGLEPYLAQIKAELDTFTSDVSTKKGRDAIASIAHKVARSKTALDNIGKELVAELKDVPKKIDAERKRMRDLLDQWRDDVRAPLTAWEEAEASREAAHKAGIEWFLLRAKENSDLDAGELRRSLTEVDGKAVDESWQEFEAEAHRAKAKAVEGINAALAAREKYEAEQTELAELRAKAAAQEQKEREDCIAREAADRAKQEAEAKARAEIEIANKREAEAKAAAERRELEFKLAAEKAEREKLEAEKRAVQATKDAEARVKAAAEAERQRIAKEQAEALAEQQKREANKAHKGAINRQALADFIAGGLSEECAKLAVTLIVQRKVANVAIHY